MNRVILLSDGLANRGQTNPDAIASDVYGLAQRGVSTTTMGVGRDYNEDLMELMAKSGDGNYYYIESPDQLPDIFQMEMQGIMATIGRNVRLRIEPQGDVELLDVFNDFEVNRQGEFQLPNLIMGNPFIVAVRLNVPPIPEATPLCYFRLSWDAPEGEERQKIRESLQLPVVSDSQLEDFPLNREVQEQVTLMISARAKQEAVKKVDRGEYEEASDFLLKVREEVMAVPQSLSLEQEAQSLRDLDRDLKARRLRRYRKRARYESHSLQRSSFQTSHGDYYTERNQKSVRHKIEVIRGDLTRQQVDGIVNSSDRSLSGSFGVDDAIQHAGGSQLQEACRQLNGCDIGQAKITKGYNLPAEWVIHTVGPNWIDGNQEEENELAQCYRNCLALAEQYSLQTIAFPSISTGMKGFPNDWAARIAVREVVNFLIRNDWLEKVIFVCFEQYDYDCYIDVLS
ncbi:MAG: VWA domain-containing protein [Moorea sp. SIO2B7]|nr:VWA domain-containing protein [Moorena sp. SIO2B7]